MRLKISSDWLNPMLMRDLRQGLRARGFTVGFLLLQCAMALFVASGLFSADRANLGDLLSALFWAGMVFFFFVGLPLAAANSLTLEFRDNRLDLLKLTQMRARGLMWGKWFSLSAQGALVAISLLPYMILNYFVGSYDLVSDLGALVITLGASAVMVAAGLAISSVNLVVVRALVIIASIFAILYVLGGGIGMIFMMMSMRGGGRMGGGMGGGPAMFSGNFDFPAAFLLLLCVGLPALFLFLEFGASRLAPSAENHDTPQRFVVLVLMVLGAAMMGAGSWSSSAMYWKTLLQVFFVFMLIQTIWVLALAAATDPSPYPGAYRLFVRRGLLGRLVGRLFLYQGWPSAVFFILLVSGVLACFSVWVDFSSGNSSAPDDRMAFYLLLTPALMFPQVVGSLLFKRRSSGARYLWVLAICVTIAIMCAIFSGFTDSRALYVFACLFPPDALFLLKHDVLSDLASGDLYAVGALAAAATSMPTLAIVMVRSVRYWPKFIALERRAAAPAPSSVPPPAIPPASANLPPIAEKPAGA
jgi:hypothetical protein